MTTHAISGGINIHFDNARFGNKLVKKKKSKKRSPKYKDIIYQQGDLLSKLSKNSNYDDFSSIFASSELRTRLAAHKAFENDMLLLKEEFISVINRCRKQLHNSWSLVNFNDLDMKRNDLLSSLVVSIATRNQLSLMNFITRKNSRTRNIATGRSYQSTDARTKKLKYYSSRPSPDGTIHSSSTTTISQTLNFTEARFNILHSHSSIPANNRDMKIESNRLYTFFIEDNPFNVPENKPDLVEQLAADGFYYTLENSDTVQCAYCKISISDWNKIDRSPHDEHRLRAGTCPFVLRLQVGNVAVINDESGLPLSQCCSETSDSHYSYVSGFEGISTRSETCEAILDAIHDNAKLSEISFNSISVQFKNFDSVTMNRRKFDCMVQEMQKSAVLPVDRKTAVHACSSNALSNLGGLSSMSYQDALSYYPQIHPLYQCDLKREESLDNWFQGVVSLWLMSNAGFFYSQNGDKNLTGVIQCYWCNLKIRSWNSSMDPWIEHARWSPRCMHVLLHRGAQFVQHVHQTFPPFCYDDFEHDTNTTVSRNNYSTSKRHYPIFSEEPMLASKSFNSVDYRLEQREVKGRMDLDGTKLFIDMGFRNDEVKTALYLNLKQTGDDFNYLSLFFDALWNQRRFIENSNSSVAEYESEILKQVKESRENVKNGGKKLVARDLQTGDWRLCKICMDQVASIIFLNCGHFCSCERCSENLKTCPMCRSSIRGTLVCSL